MNLFHFLRSTRGAIKPLNALLISGAAGVVFAYTVGTVSDKQVSSERQVRTLSGIESTAPQQGMLMQNGRLTSINVGDGRGQLATAEERAAMQGNKALDRYMANQRALEGMDATLGRAAQFSETDGLNTGNRDIHQIPGQFVQGTSVDTGAGVTGAVTRAGAQAQGTEAVGGRPSLAPASITRASGNNSGSSAGAVSGGIVGGPGQTGGSEGMRMSGAMPSGSNIVSQRGLDKGPLGNSGTSSFKNGRDGYIARGPKAVRGKNELDDISKRSARAAASNSPSANEGAQAFIQGATQGGVVVTRGADTEGGTGSEDLKNPSDHKLRAIGNHLQGVENELENRQSENRALKWQMIATILGTIAAMVAGAFILAKLDELVKAWEFEASVATLPADKAACTAMAAMFKFRRHLLGLALFAAVAGANAFLVLKATQFIHKYAETGGVGMAKACQWIAPILVGGMLFTVLSPKTMKTVFSNIWKNMKTALSPVGMVAKTAKNALLGAIFK